MFSIDLLHEIRDAEIDMIMARFPAGARILEIGAGTGRQALAIRNRGFEVEAIEIPDSNYREHQAFPITAYDGREIPFPDASFDVVFSSNVLEHVRDLAALEAEIKRVLRPGGFCVHVMPTHIWRLWCTLAAFPASVQKVAALARTPRPSGRFLATVRWALGTIVRSIGTLLHPFVQGRHGERGVWLSEFWLFRPAVWRRHFLRSGFEIVRDEPMGLHYSGHFVLGGRWSVAKRMQIAKRVGSACHLFEVRPLERR
jgi:ubiquinone/menaquinone biosynthesis C-methylase UbiE